MKFAIVTDIHLGLERQYKDVPTDKNIKKILDDFIIKMNNTVKPEFIVVLGDLIEDANEINDIIDINYIINLFKKLKCSVYYVAGNHDLKNISKEKLTKLFNQKSLYYSFDSDSYHFIVLFSKESDDKTILISDEQKKWFKKDLNKTNKKSIIFTHHSLANQDLTGNHWFEGMPENCLITNRKDIRNVILKSNKVIAVFNGHLHWNKQNLHNNVPYFTIQSLTENNEGVTSETHAVINIEDNKVNVEIKGN